MTPGTHNETEGSGMALEQVIAKRADFIETATAHRAALVAQVTDLNLQIKALDDMLGNASPKRRHNQTGLKRTPEQRARMSQAQSARYARMRGEAVAA